MKHILFLVCCCFPFAACNLNINTPGNKGLPATFTPIVSGTWVMTDYINELGKTKSPKAASVVLKDVVSMNIDPSMLKGDSLEISVSLGNHEGYFFNLYFRQGQDEQSLTTGHTDNEGGFYELAYAANNNDTSLVLNHYSKDKKLLDKKAFTKVTGVQSENGEPYGLQYMANKVLLAGKYTVADDSGKTSEVTLTDDGMATGLGTHSTYFIFTDFFGIEETNLDEMCFDERTKNQKAYIFEINTDTVHLYKAQENEDRTLLIKGPLKYTMVKQR